MLPLIIASGLGYAFYKTEQGSQMDAKAQRKYAKAMTRQLEAEALLKEKKENADAALIKVANRKRAIVATSMYQFLDVYERIIKIDFQESDEIKKLNAITLIPEEVTHIKTIAQTAVKPMTDREVIVTLLKGTVLFGGLGGIGYSIAKDAERNLKAANAQLRMAEMAYKEAETIGLSLDTVVDRANALAGLLAKLNLLFRQSIQHTTEIIDRNGYSRTAYNQDDRKALMTCINIASTMKKIIDEPVITPNGELAIETAKTLEIGNNFIKQVEQLV